MANVFVATICPLFGNLLAIIMLLSPMPAVISVRRTKQMGALNPLPYPLTALNCIGWTVYGIIIDNVWVVPANLVGLCAGVYFTLQTLPHIKSKEQDRIVGLLVVAAGYFGVLGLLGGHLLGSDERGQMWGLQSVIVLLCYYAIPLSSMVHVVKTRDAASIYLPLAAASIANGTMWTVYGLFAVKDINLWLPNGIGAVLGIVQICLRLFYGAKPAIYASAASETESNPSSGMVLLSMPEGNTKHIEDSNTLLSKSRSRQHSSALEHVEPLKKFPTSTLKDATYFRTGSGI